MTEPRSFAIVESLRARILRGLQAATLSPGSRLPSAREVAGEFDVDHRVILAAYRRLADEGLVDVRGRGGIYVSARSGPTPGNTALPEKWFVDTLTDAFVHELSAAETHEWLRRATESLRLHATVISTTDDQVAGLVRELADVFGFIAEGITGDELASANGTPAFLRNADVVIATSAYIDLAHRWGSALNTPVIAIDVRPDLAAGEWALLLRNPVWAIVATADFGDMLKRYFENVKGVENLHILVYGRDDLSQIPDDAPTYVTQRVRQRLGDVAIKGRLLPAARTISSTSARALFEFIVSANLAALRGARSILRYDSATQPPNPARDDS